MIGIGRIYRQIIINQIKAKLANADSFYIVYYKGLSAAELDTLRRLLKQVNSRLFVSKDSLGRLVLKELNWESLINLIKGSVGFVFIESDPISTSRILVNFAKGHSSLALGGGILKNQLLTKEDFISLASLPSQNVLLAKVVGGIKFPLTALAITLNQTLGKVVLLLKAVMDKKDK